jgi:DNA replication protein DnaC
MLVYSGPEEQFTPLAARAARQARESGSEYKGFLASLIESEIEGRADKRLKRRTRDARFPLMKTMESFYFDAATSLDRRFIRKLAEGTYIGEKRNSVFFCQPTVDLFEPPVR